MRTMFGEEPTELVLTLPLAVPPSALKGRSGTSLPGWVKFQIAEEVIADPPKRIPPFELTENWVYVVPSYTRSKPMAVTPEATSSCPGPMSTVAPLMASSDPPVLLEKE